MANEPQSQTHAGCPECLRHEIKESNLERDLREAKEEAAHWRGQNDTLTPRLENLQSTATQAQQQAQQAAQQLAEERKDREAAEQAPKGHDSCSSLFGCETHGAQARRELAEHPDLLDKDTAKRITEAHFPGIFSPINIDR